MDENHERALAGTEVAHRVPVELDLLEMRLAADAPGRRGGRHQRILMPEIAREMTRRWISEVPSKIV